MEQPLEIPANGRVPDSGGCSVCAPYSLRCLKIILNRETIALELREPIFPRSCYGACYALVAAAAHWAEDLNDSCITAHRTLDCVFLLTMLLSWIKDSPTGPPADDNCFNLATVGGSSQRLAQVCSAEICLQH